MLLTIHLLLFLLLFLYKCKKQQRQVLLVRCTWMVLYFLSDEHMFCMTLHFTHQIMSAISTQTCTCWIMNASSTWTRTKGFCSTSFHILKNKKKHNTTSDVAVSEIHIVTETVMATANVHSATFTPKLTRSRDLGRTTIRRQHNTQHAHPPSWGWGSAWVSFKWTSVTGAPLRKPREQQQATQTTFKRRSNCDNNNNNNKKRVFKSVQFSVLL